MPPPDKPIIEYPSIWSYKIIGNSEVDVREVVDRVLGDREYTLEASRASSAGKYESHNLSVVVMSDSDRVGIYQQLSSHPLVKIVL